MHPDLVTFVTARPTRQSSGCDASRTASDGYCSVMASKAAQLDHLRQVPMFAGCTKRELQAILKAGDEITMTAGTLIVDQGQMGREAFVLLEGNVTVRRSGRKVTGLGPGAIVGELSLLDHGPRTASVICDTDCTLFVLDQRHFQHVIEQNPQIALKLLGTLASDIRNLDRQSFG